MCFGSWFSGKSLKTNTSCMLNNPLSRPLSLITNHFKNTSAGNIHWTTDTEIGLNPSNLSKLQSHTLPRIICKPEPPQSERLSGLTRRSDCISLPALCWEELTAGMTFCQRRLHSQTKQPCNLVSHFNQVTDKKRISPDFCDNIVRTRTPPPATNTSIAKPTSLRHTEAFSMFFPDLVRGISRPLMLANKAAVCLISDCCHGYSKQGERGLCLWTNTSPCRSHLILTRWNDQPIS